MAVSGARSSGPVLRSLSPSRAFPGAQRYQSYSSPAKALSFDNNNRSISAASPRSHVVKGKGNGGQKRSCMCSPTNHPGSFRCSLHKNKGSEAAGATGTPYKANGLDARRSAMANSLVRIGTVEGELVKRALAALIRPTSHSQRRRSAFQARRSRLSVMSKAEDSS